MWLWIDYLLVSLPGILITGLARARILRARALGSRIPAGSGRTGAETAERILQAGGVTGVAIERSAGELSDHYDARHRTLRLSRGVYSGRTLADLGVAAHEAGHALQDAAGYPGRVLRNTVVPWAGLGAQVCGILLVGGVWLGIDRLVVAAILLFSTLLVLQLLNLPVELDASRRSREVLRSTSLVSADEDPVIARVANAAAWTHVAAFVPVPSSVVRAWNRGVTRVSPADAASLPPGSQPVPHPLGQPGSATQDSWTEDDGPVEDYRALR